MYPLTHLDYQRSKRWIRLAGMSQDGSFVETVFRPGGLSLFVQLSSPLLLYITLRCLLFSLRGAIFRDVVVLSVTLPRWYLSGCG